MNIEVLARNVDLTDALAKHAQDRFTYALNQYDHRVGQVTVRLKDVNGPKGGVSKVCDAEIKLQGLPDLMVSKQDADLYLAITAAADTAKVAVGRALSKLKDHHPR